MEKDTRFDPVVFEMAKVLDRRKAEDIILLDVKKATILADTFIVCSGRSTPHVKTLADELDEAMGRAGVERRRMEGYAAGRWIVMAVGDILVHLCHKEEREFYNIERLWKDEGNFLEYEGTPETDAE